jgi:hypothetical protein
LTAAVRAAGRSGIAGVAADVAAAPAGVVMAFVVAVGMEVGAVVVSRVSWNVCDFSDEQQQQGKRWSG